MSITVTCPSGHLLHLEEKYAGRSGKCPHCHALVHVPKPGQIHEEEILAILDPYEAATIAEQADRPEMLAPDDATKESDKTRSDSPPPKRFSAGIYHHLGVSKHADRVVVRFGDHRILDELTVKKISDESWVSPPGQNAVI